MNYLNFLNLFVCIESLSLAFYLLLPGPPSGAVSPRLVDVAEDTAKHIEDTNAKSVIGATVRLVNINERAKLNGKIGDVERSMRTIVYSR